MRGVSLFPRRTLIGLQDAIDGRLQRSQSWLLPLVFLAFGRDRAGNRLAHHSAVYTMLLRQPLDRLSGRVSPPDLFE